MGLLSGARVVVTGGAGNVGSHLVDAAVTAGARQVEIDIRDREAVQANVAGADVVFHQAALRWTRCQEHPRECQEVMVDGTFNVLEAAADAKVSRVVIASSAVVYGDPIR